MNSTLGIVLPVCNAESTLRRQVYEMLEILPDLVSRFELLIVDQGSSDQTTDVARDLAVEYPQVRVVRQPASGESISAVQEAIDQLQADLVLVQPAGQLLRPSDLRRAVRLRGHSNEPTVALSSGIAGKLSEWGQALHGAGRPKSQTAAALPTAHPPVLRSPILRRAARGQREKVTE